MALESGRPPLRLLDEGSPDSWSYLDLDIIGKWKQLKAAKCPGCGRPLTQHLHNSILGREETTADYMPYSIDCPAQQAIAEGQDMWKTANKPAIDSHRAGKSPDPGMGVYWIAQGHNEALPQAEPH